MSFSRNVFFSFCSRNGIVLFSWRELLRYSTVCEPMPMVQHRLSGMTENRPEKSWIVAAIMQSYDYWRQFKIGTRISTNLAPASGGSWCDSHFWVAPFRTDRVFWCYAMTATHMLHAKNIKKKRGWPLLAVAVHILRKPFRLMISLDDILCVRCCYVWWLRANRHHDSISKAHTPQAHILFLQEKFCFFSIALEGLFSLFSMLLFQFGMIAKTNFANKVSKTGASEFWKWFDAQ